VRDIFSDNNPKDRLDEQFFNCLESNDDRDRLYVYRLLDNEMEKPAMLKGLTLPCSNLLEFLRDEHGGGEFLVMFRRGDKMLLTGRIAIAGPRLRRTPSL
jgi:hypothetical protein